MVVRRRPKEMGPAQTQRRRPKQIPEIDVSNDQVTTISRLQATADAGVEYISPGTSMLTERQLLVQAQMANDNAARHMCVVGGSRSGKTTLLVRAVVLRALKARSRHAILRFRSNAVWPSIGMDTLPKVMRTFFPGVRYIENKSLHYFEFENGSQIWLGGLDDKERTEKILGNEYSTIYFNECSQIPYASILIALSRLAESVPGLVQRAYYDLNPASTRHWSNLLFGDKVDPVSGRPLINPEAYTRAFMNPADNAANLSVEYLRSLDDMPERYRKRFRDGTYVDEADDALWKLGVLEENRRFSDELPQMVRIVVAIDPSGAKNSFDTTHDEIGIVVVGLGNDNHGYVLADRTLLAGPEQWARTAVAAYHAFRADAIVAEINFGGAMVEYTLRTIDPSIPFRMVTATRGKTVRAEPVSALYDQKRVHHVHKRNPTDLAGEEREGFARLEDELCSFTTMGYVGARSPNRADALVWAVSELMLAENASGFVEYYRRMAEGVTTTVAPARDLGDVLRAGTPNAPVPVQASGEVRLLTSPHRNFAVPDLDTGRSVMLASDVNGVLIVTDPRHVPILLGQGCLHPPPEQVAA